MEEREKMLEEISEMNRKKKCEMCEEREKLEREQVILKKRIQE